MCKPTLLKHGIIEIRIGERLERFRDYLHRYPSNTDVFSIEDHTVIAQVFYKLKIKYFVVSTPEDIKTLMELVGYVQRCFTITNYALSKFTTNCPNCGYRQFVKTRIEKCDECGTRFKPPGSS